MSPTTATRRFAFPRLLLALIIALAALLSLPVQRARAYTFIVTNGNDSGSGSLREAINGASNLGNNTITFAPEVETVTLTSSRLTVGTSLKILGGPNGVTIRRSSTIDTPAFPIFFISIPHIDDGEPMVTLQGLTISNGSGTSGGGIELNEGSLALVSSAVSNNTAVSGGGIYYRFFTGSLTIVNSTISDNTAAYGGGLHVGERYEGALNTGVTLINSTVSGNGPVEYSPFGGGIFVWGGDITLTNTTVTRNAGEFGGIGIGVANIWLRHSIVAGNDQRDCATMNEFSPAGFISQGYNLVGSDHFCPRNATGDQVLTGPVSTAINPELADNGGPTKTHAPVLGGPAVNWIPPAQCIPTTDQRGVDRPRDGACEVGAVEYAPLVSLNVPIASPGSVGLSPAGGGEGPFVYPAGTRVTLTALPNRNNLFTGWRVDGEARGWANPLTVTAGNVQQVQAIFAAPVTFPDVPIGRGDRTAIIELASRGTIRGYQNGNFGPDDGVTRAQMAALIARAMPAGPGTPPEFVSPPACVNADTWDCEAWDNYFTDQAGVSDALWRDVAALQQHRVAYGYGAAECAARGLIAPCFGPNDPVTYAQTISFITRAMREKGYWSDQPGASLPYVGIPDTHATDVRTFHFYTQSLGGIPVPPGGWDAPATRGWFAQSLWVALDSYWGATGP